MRANGRALLLLIVPLLGFVPPRSLPAMQVDTTATDTTAASDTVRAANEKPMSPDAKKGRAARTKLKDRLTSYNSPLILTIGVEASNAGGFSDAEVSPAVAISAIGVGFKTPWLVSELGVQGQFTQAANVRRFGSCRRVRVAVSGTQVEGFPGGERCVAGDEIIADTVFRNVFLDDSTRFETVGVWRAFAQGRVETPGKVRFGPILGLGVQSNPNNLTDPRQQQLKLMAAVGVGMRQFASNGTELFSIDVVRGAVQNYQQADILGQPLIDGTRSVIVDPRQPRRTKQWQVLFSLRPTQTFRIRGFITLDSPPPTSLDELPVPDLARIAFMTDRDLAEIVDAILGGKEREPEPGEKPPEEQPEESTEAQNPVPAL